MTEVRYDDLSRGPAFGVRHVIVILLFLLMAIGLGMRVSISVAIVAMTDNTTSRNPDIPAYDWDDKSVVLSSFFWGYVALQFIAGLLGKTYGVKWFLMGAILVSSFASMMIPLLADKLGSKGVMGCRVVQGLAEGFYFPLVHDLVGQWAPPSERSRFGSIISSGAAFGIMVSYTITGYISASWIGWPPVFYLFGIIGCVWALTWSIFGANCPAQHAHISEEERNYIETSLGTTKVSQSGPTPWKAIFTSLPVYAIIVGSIGHNWAATTLLTEVPNYMHKVMKFDMHSDSLMSAAPYLGVFLFCVIFGNISDYLINNRHLSRGNTRKLFHTIGTFVPAVALVVLGFLPADSVKLSVAMLMAAIGMNAATMNGFKINMVDISPKFSGIIMGIVNSVAAGFSIIAPLVVQVVVTDETDKSLWRKVFIIAASIYLVTDIFFVCFATGEVQWWNDIENDKIGMGIFLETKDKENLKHNTRV